MLPPTRTLMAMAPSCRGKGASKSLSPQAQMLPPQVWARVPAQVPALEITFGS